MLTIKCFPWSYWDKIAVIGDAAHAVLPFYGQGMNAGFEDIIVLDKWIKKYPEDWEKAFKKYEKERKPDTDALSTLSFQNFKEMSKKTVSADFLLQKKIETYFSQKYPQLWSPLYSQVSFSNIPYSQALKKGKKQKKIMKKIMRIKNISKVWKEKWVSEKLLSILQKNKTLIP